MAYAPNIDTVPWNRSPRRGNAMQATLACGLLIFAASLALFAVNTRHGIAIYSDSTRYMGISERPYDAPLYAWALQGFAALGLSLPKAAVLVALLSLGANIGLSLCLLVRGTERWGAAGLGAALIVFAPQFVTLQASAMSEPLFVALSLATILCALRYFDTRRRSWLVATGLALGAASLTRFAAPALGASIVMVLFLEQKNAKLRRLADAGLVGGLSASIFLAWVVASQLALGHSVGRELAFHGTMGSSEWLKSLQALTAWLLPDSVPLAIRISLLAWLFSVGAILTFRQTAAAMQEDAKASRPTELMIPLLGFYLIFYLLFMLLATSIEANLHLNSRYAFPAYVTTVILLTSVVCRIPEYQFRDRLLRQGMALIAVVVLGGHVVRSALRSEDAYARGVGFQEDIWRQSPTIAALKTLPADAEFYSNGPDVVSYLTGHKARFIPQHVALRTNLPDPVISYASQMANISAAASQRITYVVYLYNVDWRFYLATEADLGKELNLTRIGDFSDGRIFQVWSRQ